MECNREEALRAKEMAEKKMESKDFSTALKIAVKAQQLYPQLENVSQMIVVCEVHISGEMKTYGAEKDWYAILKVEPSADEASIKKQYRKLALILHPDKNKFSGSTDAFKLIGEAQRILLDRDKRLLHDSKRRSFGKVSAQSWNPRQPSRPTNAQPHPWNQTHPVNYNNFTGVRPGNFQFPQQQQQAPTGIRLTFWTVCPFCSVRYQFYRDDVLNKVINCQNCKKSFTAFELNTQSSTAATQTRQPPRQTKIPVNLTQPVFTQKTVFEKPVNLNLNTKPQGSVNNRKRKRVVHESSESSDSSSESEEEEEDAHVESDENGVPKKVDTNQFFGEEPRRSSRARRNVSYKENVNDIDHDDNGDDDEDDADAEKEVEDKFWKAEVKKDQKKDSESNNGTKNDDNKFPHDDNKERHEPNSADNEEDDSSEEDSEPVVFECPEPDFSDFEKNRKEESFRAGQLWACYDTDDAMPRFYAFVKKVLSPGFKLQIFWLKPDPVSEEEIKWVDDDLPVSCGRFTRGKHDRAEDLYAFSHLVSWESARSQKGGAAYNILPRKGETWALFKNWDINWRTDEKRKYEYEFVEILSDYDENSGVRVSYLEKVKGFVSIFRPKKEDKETVIGNGSDKYRFAHMVPSVRMSGEERKGVPKGSYELDPAALPQSIFEQLDLLDDNDDEDDAEKGVEDKFWRAEVKKEVEDQKRDTENNNSVKNDNNKFPHDANKECQEPNSADKEEEDSSE
nr:hypothetical protein [Tanacetum cinerariifolium]